MKPDKFKLILAAMACALVLLPDFASAWVCCGAIGDSCAATAHCSSGTACLPGTSSCPCGYCSGACACTTTSTTTTATTTTQTTTTTTTPTVTTTPPVTTTATTTLPACPYACNTYTECSASGGTCQSGYSCVYGCCCLITATTTTTLPACPYACNTYTECSASGGTCQSGYACSFGCCCQITATTTVAPVTTTTIAPTTTTTTTLPLTTCAYECSFYTSWMCVGPVDLGCDIYPSKLGTSSCGYDCVEKGSPGQFSDCASTHTCMCYRVEQCESGDACIDTYGCIPEATSRCQSFSERFKCGDNTCPYQPIINQACCPWGKETDGTIGDCYSGGYASCILDTPSPETICSGGDDEDCDSKIDCADPDCAGAVNCPTTCAYYQPCAVDCAVGSVCAATYSTTSSCYHGLSSCCSCSESGVCGDCDLGYGHCSYSLVDNMKEVTCTQSCEKVGEVNTLKTPKLVDGSYVNVCDKDSGWLCDYTSTSVECCEDADCVEAGVYCKPPVSVIDYGNRYAKCDTNLHTCSFCGRCESTAVDCASGYCCTEDTPGPKDGTGKCVGPATSKYSSAWLCAQ